MRILIYPKSSHIFFCEKVSMDRLIKLIFCSSRTVVASSVRSLIVVLKELVRALDTGKSVTDP